MWIQSPDSPDIPPGTGIVSTGNPVSCKSGLHSLINICLGVVFYRQICKISTLSGLNYASQTAALRERRTCFVSQFMWWSFIKQLRLWLLILLFFCKQSKVLCKFCTQSAWNMCRSSVFKELPNTHLILLWWASDKQVVTELCLKLIHVTDSQELLTKNQFVSPSWLRPNACVRNPVIRGFSSGTVNKICLHKASTEKHQTHPRH